MPNYTTADIRNILIAGHGGCGKTTLTDALLFASNTVNRKGSVGDGSSFSDFEKEEKEHGHSIYPALLHADHAGKRINLIDSPGSPDLIGQALACMPAVETVAVVVNAQSGVEVVTRRIMEAAKERNIPRAIIVNKIDMPDVDLEALVEQLRETFGPECLPINLPAKGGKAVVDCLLSTDGESDFDTVKRCHAAILDQIVEMDENLMEKYLGGEEPDYDALHAPFEKAMDEAHVVPILFTDAKNGAGIADLLDAMARHFPSPLEGNPRPFLSGEGESERGFQYANNPNGLLLAHVFKVTTDPFVGKLAIFRVHQGKAAGNTQVFIGHSKKSIKLGHVFHLQGKEHREADAIIAGDIGAVAKLEDIHGGDVLHDDHALDSVHLKPLAFPTPMYGLAVTPKARGDEQKISTALAKIMEEDPTFKWHTDRQTHEVVINGLGELHLRLVLEKLKNRGLQVDTKPPKIAYRETISMTAEGHHRHKKQTGGAGQFGEVFLRVEPLEDSSPHRKDAGGSGYEIVNEVFGGTIPGQFIPAVEKGIHDLMDQGVIAGYPMQDIRVAITDGKHHPVDSKEVAFRAAGKFAFKDAVLKARPVLLEPIVNMEVTVPETNVGSITGDLSGKRGRIQGTDILPGGMAQVTAKAPLSEVMQYQSQLKSVTGGQGSFVMELSHYEAVPAHVQQQIAAQYKPKAEEE
ncbi:MAG: Elongation factor [Phycisphaerales bacterium]|nr:Elongation factor [Phycisphaerales bacterium]MDB5357629.1 Elongation factor [Phycisphaerales bacterium]